MDFKGYLVKNPQEDRTLRDLIKTGHILDTEVQLFSFLLDLFPKMPPFFCFDL